jgi:glyoxylase-like metal-dependent hydrolase (beta-lactamase superfamily II)
MTTADDLWQLHDESVLLATTTYGPQNARMAVIGIGDGGLLIVSPGTGMSDAAWARVAAWGAPRFLLAPNHFHNAGLAKWQARFPAAQIVAHPRALARLRKKLPGREIADLAPLQAALPPGVRVFNPPGAKQGETLVAVQRPAGPAWFVTDALVNESKLPGGATGLLIRLLGFRTGLITNPFFKRFFLADRPAYKQWLLAELERDRPTLFIPAHGDPLAGPDLVDRLRATTAAL